MDVDFKLSFLKSLKISHDAVPYLFIENCRSYTQDTTDLERWFSNSDSLSLIGSQKVCLKDIIGTNNESYANKGWLDAFLSTKGGKETIEFFKKNPSYYTHELRDEKQSCNIPLQVFLKDGKYYIKDGNNRILFLKILYLTELSDIKADLEKEKIDEKYSFYMQVNKVPEKKEIISIIYALKGFGYDFKRASKEECHYNVYKENDAYQIQSFQELKKLFKQSISFAHISSKEGILKQIEHNIQFYTKDVQKLHLNALFLEVLPNFELFKTYYLSVKKRKTEEELLRLLERTNLSYENLFFIFEQMSLKEEENDFYALFSNYQSFNELYEKVISHPYTKKAIQTNLNLQEFIHVFNKVVPFLNSSFLPRTYEETVKFIMKIELTKQYEHLLEQMEQEKKLQAKLYNLEKVQTILEHSDFLNNLCIQYKTAKEQMEVAQSHLKIEEKSLINKQNGITEKRDKLEKRKKQKGFKNLFSKEEKRKLEKEIEKELNEKKHLEVSYTNSTKTVQINRVKVENALKELKTLLSSEITFSYVESILKDETLSLDTIHKMMNTIQLQILSLNVAYRIEELKNKALAYDIDLEKESIRK